MDVGTAKRTFAGRYAIERELGVGGTAVVYLAHDVRHDRRVAVKVLRPEVAAAVGSDRFLREIQIAASLSHPHILPLHDSGDADGALYYVMPFVEGPSLRDRLNNERQLPVDVALQIAQAVADGLDYAHRQGVIHRDVKPENILFYEGHVALTDFGIARAPRRPDASRPTAPGMAVGTPEYMSPEACAGADDLDARADQYSLACVLYEMLAGGPPFTAATPQGVAARHMVDVIPPLATVRPDLLPGIAGAIERALAKVPADRWPSLAAFAGALQRAAAGEAEAATRSVAVLPFANSGGLPEDEALSDGITDEIIAALSRVEGLRVASRTSVFAHKGKGQDVRTIAAHLHVGAVLEGSIRRMGSRLRVSVQLVSARDGYLLWTERYDRDLRDVFEIEDQIAQAVARALRVILRDGRRLARRSTQDVRAYEYYLRGRQYFQQTRRKSLEFAREMFQRAIAADPDFALAWAGVADCCALLHMYYPSQEDLALADEASSRGVTLGPDLAETHAARGFALWQLGRIDEAITELNLALSLDSSSFAALYVSARLAFQRGDADAAARLFERAARAREDYQARFFAAQALAALGRKAEAEAAYRRALHVVQEHLELNPDDARAATMCGVALCRLGRWDEGIAWADRARAIEPNDAGVLYNVACLYGVAGRVDDALDCLEQAVRGGFGDREWIQRDPDLEPLRAHPRYRAMVARLGGPP